MSRTLVRFLALALFWALPAWAEPPPPPTLSGDHPLVGRVWAPATGKWSSPQGVMEGALGAGIVLLGETHDNADHHALQAWMLRELAKAGRRPLLALEMVDMDRQALLDQNLSDPATLGAALEWEKRGWPDWNLYRPIIGAALAARGEVKAANLPQDLTRRIAKGEQGAEVDGRFGLDQALSAAEDKALSDDIRQGHCGMLPDKAVPGMVRVQRARDAAMAEVLADQASRPEAGPAVLIAGAGHVRNDRGVPARLRAMVPGITILTIGFVEVEEAKSNPAAYGRPPFDLVWFTNRAARQDPCAAMEKHMKKKEEAGR
ncbi:putative Lipoprotein [Paramagnetospirillum magnetotacticum MS-1]|uniref:Putative Lipoprotein n=1 Tax=Paramagnetospirillum magnetotacticum MS-1 TaxID=272627 RepID=A0A0C2UW41_PARME|nr:ChaN family lipoprotein [Paramagnetospirillum magnetotacticum]KIL97031.1 putative Lipoprotein [Paramagnetospirillum magnetotacticum MS-1]